jgi:hypothetical protein
VLVWNLRTGKTVKVSGKKTAAADSTSTGAGVFQLALAGTRVAWLLNEGGNLEGDDYLFTSSVTKPQEHQVASAIRNGDGCPGRSFSHCAGPWLGGVVGSGNLIAANRWTTDGNGVVTAGQLDVLSGTKLKQVAIGASTVQAAVADSGRVAVLRADGSVALYSAAGKPLLTVNPGAEAIALKGKSLVVATTTRKPRAVQRPHGVTAEDALRARHQTAPEPRGPGKRRRLHDGIGGRGPRRQSVDRQRPSHRQA